MLSNDNVGRKTVIFDRSENLGVMQVAVPVGNEYLRYYIFTQGIFSSIDPEQLGGGKDLSVQEKYQPVYFAVKDLDTGVLVGIIGGHRTSASTFRIRAIHAFKPYTMEEFAPRLVDALSQHVYRCEGVTSVWLKSDPDNVSWFEELGFVVSGPARNGDFYMTKLLVHA